jgi:hypothetical protein
MIYWTLKWTARHRKPLPPDRSAAVAAIIGLLLGPAAV